MRVGILIAIPPGAQDGDETMITMTWGDPQYYQNSVVVVSVIPTLSEWGMIIFCVLLLGFMAWVIVRKRRSMEVGI